jgi:hypothetical protein
MHTHTHTHTHKDEISGHNADIRRAAAYIVLRKAVAENFWPIINTSIEITDRISKLAAY